MLSNQGDSVTAVTLWIIPTRVGLVQEQTCQAAEDRGVKTTAQHWRLAAQHQLVTAVTYVARNQLIFRWRRRAAVAASLSRDPVWRQHVLAVRPGGVRTSWLLWLRVDLQSSSSSVLPWSAAAATTATSARDDARQLHVISVWHCVCWLWTLFPR